MTIKQHIRLFAILLFFVSFVYLLLFWVGTRTPSGQSLLTIEELKADVLSYPYTATAGATATAAGFNGNFNAAKAIINGLIDSFNIEDGSVLDADVAASGITTVGKVNSSALVGTLWSDLTDGGSTALHAHSGFTGTISFASVTGTLAASRVVVADVAGNFAGTEVESVLAEMAASVTLAIAAAGAVEATSTSGTFGFGTSTAWGLMIDTGTAAHDQPTDFSGLVDARTLLSSVAGAHPGGNVFMHGEADYSVCAGIQFVAINTGTVTIIIGRGPASQSSYWYIDNTLAFTVAHAANGSPTSVTDQAPHTSSAIAGGAFQNLNFVISATGTHVIEDVNTEDANGWQFFTVMNNWLYDSDVSVYAPYIRY